MASGIELIERIDTVLNDMGISRKQFASKINIQTNTMGNWKSNNSIPSVDTIQRIAKELSVSVNWLIDGDTNFEVTDAFQQTSSRANIRKRIYASLKKLNENDNHFSDDYLDNENILKEIHEAYFDSQFASYKELYNWSKGRFEIDLSGFHTFAIKLNISLDYLFTGGDIQTYVKEKYSKPFQPDLYETALEFIPEIFNLNCLSPKRLELAKSMLNELKNSEMLETRFSKMKQNN